MADTARPQQEERRSPLAISNLPEEILSEILLLLPPKSVLRCRAVCKAWRRVTSDGAFLLAHHRRQPPRRLLTFVRDVGAHSDRLELVDYCVEAIDFSNHEFRSLVRFTGDFYDDNVSDGPFAVHAACNGLLLMSYSNCLYLVNPTTRQWVSVFPPALQHDTVAGLYVHGPSSEYRVLYYREIDDSGPMFYISTLGSGKERWILPHSSLVSVRRLLAGGSDSTNFKEPFLFHGNLHWLSHLPRCRNILLFDTISEVFRWLPSPDKVGYPVQVSSLLEIDGMLALSNTGFGGSKVDLWLLEVYERVIWVRKYHIELRVMEISSNSSYVEDDECWCSHILSGEGDVLVDDFDWQLHYD